MMFTGKKKKKLNHDAVVSTRYKLTRALFVLLEARDGVKSISTIRELTDNYGNQPLLDEKDHYGISLWQYASYLKNHEGLTLLQCAAKTGENETVTLLIKADLDLSPTSLQGTAFDIALHEGHVDICAMIMAKIPDIMQLSQNQTLIYKGISGHPRLSQTCLYTGAHRLLDKLSFDLDEKKARNEVPCLDEKWAGLLKKMLRRDDIRKVLNGVNSDGACLLAVAMNHRCLVEALVDHAHANVNVKIQVMAPDSDTRIKTSLLSYLLYLDNKDVAVYLISKGAQWAACMNWSLALEKHGIAFLMECSETLPNRKGVRLNMCAVAALQKIESLQKSNGMELSACHVAAATLKSCIDTWDHCFAESPVQLGNIITSAIKAWGLCDQNTGTPVWIQIEQAIQDTDWTVLNEEPAETPMSGVVGTCWDIVISRQMIPAQPARPSPVAQLNLN